MHTGKQVFDYIQGVWQIERIVYSHYPSEEYTATGYGVFIVSTDDANLIHYSEKLTLSKLNSNNDKIIVTRKYLYRYDPTTLILYKYFDDGRVFYQLNINNDGIKGEHVCINDQYLARYILAQNQFTLNYSVIGLSKSYNISSKYIRGNSLVFLAES